MVKSERSSKPPIIAAGAVVLRAHPDADDLDVLVVHRPHHEDWSLPKGKLDKGEHPQAAAIREVAEETGVAIRLGPPLPDVHYDVTTRSGRLRRKTVHWWLGIVRDGDVVDASGSAGEVDEIAWVSVTEAPDILTYPDDRAQLAAALDLPATTPLVVLRHGRALSRADWEGDDLARPLTDVGLAQAREDAQVLDAYGVSRVVTSPSWRCVATVLPFATASGLELDRVPALDEPHHADDPESTLRYCARLAAGVASSGQPTAVCGHRPAFGSMLEGFELPQQRFATGELLIAHLDGDGQAVALEHVRPHAGS